MTDIVERLRTSSTNGKMCDEAADEIERLRAAIAAENEACAHLVELSRKLAGTTIVAAAIRARVKQ